MTHRSWHAGDSWVVLVDVKENPGARTLTREITTFRRAGGAYRRRFERHHLDVPRRSDVERWLRDAGFSVRVTCRYGSSELPPGRLAFRARRRA